MTKPQINVTPLIDVLLVLLIIFMVVTPMKPSAFEAQIPSEPTRDPRVNPDPNTLVVAIALDSALRLNQNLALGTVDDPQELITELRSIFDQRTQNMSSAGTAAAPPS